MQSSGRVSAWGHVWMGPGIHILGNLHRQFACPGPNNISWTLPVQLCFVWKKWWNESSMCPWEAHKGLCPSDVRRLHVERTKQLQDPAEYVFQMVNVYRDAQMLFMWSDNNGNWTGSKISLLLSVCMFNCINDMLHYCNLLDCPLAHLFRRCRTGLHMWIVKIKVVPEGLSQ